VRRHDPALRAGGKTGRSAGGVRQQAIERLAGTRETRFFGQFSEPLKEIIEARIWAGLHFRAADVQAAELGRNVAEFMEGITSSRSTDAEAPRRCSLYPLARVRSDGPPQSERLNPRPWPRARAHLLPTLSTVSECESPTWTVRMSPTLAATLGAVRSVCMVVGLPFARWGSRPQARPGRQQVIACMTARLARAAQIRALSSRNTGP
jgi:hypothetical protein